MMNKCLVFALIVLLKLPVVSNAQTVTLDYYFNRETHKTAAGMQRFHYLWDEKQNTGFSILGDVFKKNAFNLDTLGAAPTLANLRKSDIYIIVDPDNQKESPKPNYITKKDADRIAAWVKAGGILVMMANDSINVELLHFNDLAEKFGMHFKNDLQNHVIDDNHFSEGEVVYVNNQIFTSKPKIFIKDACGISLNNAMAEAVFKSLDGAVIAATVRYGKGTVFAVGDPWLYDEYVNGRLPAIYQNDVAANELVIWLKKQIPKKK